MVMGMARMTDIDELLEEVVKIQASGGDAEKRVGEITLAITNTPTEEIVRCKDCKAWNRYEPASVSGRCGFLCKMRMDDDFCSYGERGEGNG
jgi:hypothetical protein